MGAIVLKSQIKTFSTWSKSNKNKTTSACHFWWLARGQDACGTLLSTGLMPCHNYKNTELPRGRAIGGTYPKTPISYSYN